MPNNINRISNRSVNQIRNNSNMTSNSSRSRNKTTIYLVVIIILLLLIGGIVAAYYLGFIPKTKHYYVRLLKSFYEDVKCENIDNISFMLKHFGYLDKTYDNVDVKEVNDALKKFQNDYNKISDDESISNKLEDIENNLVERCGS